MKRRPFKLTLGPNEAAMITEDDGVFVVEPMRFLWPSQAKAWRNRSQGQKRRAEG